MEKVSVIIPTFNRENTLLRAVNSALQQTYAVHEILVCDDGSTDHSKKLISNLNNPKVKWLDCGKNGMPSIPRNKGIKAASGDWIAFLDSDDEWLPNKIETQLKALQEANSQAVSCNTFRIVGEKNMGAYHSFTKNSLTFQDFLPVNNNVCSSVMISKKLLEETSLFPEEKEYKAIEDYALWLRIATKTNFNYVAEPLLKYYDNPTSSVRTNYTNVWDLRKVVFTGLLEWIEKNKVQLSAEDQKKLASTYSEILNGGKTSLWKKVIQKFKN